MKNKQRLTLLTRKEKAAADTGGWVDERIPHDLLRQRLMNEGGREFDIDAILPKIAYQVGWVRMTQKHDAAHMEPKEIAQQAKETVAVIDELLSRLQHLHPHLAAEADYILFKARKEFVLSIKQRVQPDLYLLRASINQACGVIQKRPVKTGPKRNGWMVARDAIAKLLREHSKPTIAAKTARALAVELLELCDLPSPRGR